MDCRTYKMVIRVGYLEKNSNKWNMNLFTEHTLRIKYQDMEGCEKWDIHEANRFYKTS